MFIFTLICIFLLTLYGVLIEYYRRAWKAIPSYQFPPATPPSARTKISVLVPARNEDKNIGPCLDSLSCQSYPKDLYQVIVIDDHSTDRTWEIMESLFYPDMFRMSLRLADYEPEGNGVKAYKKIAIDTGIRFATGDLIVTTDADCQFHPDWLRTIAGFYEATGAKFIAAPVRIGSDPADGTGQAGRGIAASFLSIFQTLDFITLQGITGASVYKKFHDMCNGANLAYEKKAFIEAGGFEGIDRIASGDDMLLMQKIRRIFPDKINYLKSANVVVQTQPAETLKDFMNQRIRWASKADKYTDPKITAVLFLVYFFNAWIFFMAVCSFFY